MTHLRGRNARLCQAAAVAMLLAAALPAGAVTAPTAASDASPAVAVTAPTAAPGASDAPSGSDASPAVAQNQPHKTRLRNGVVVITKEVHSSDVLAITVLVRGGVSAEPDPLPGLANFTQRMLLRGTTSRTGEQVSGPIEAVGGTLQARADYDYSQLLLLGSADVLETGLDILADVVRNPRFDPAEMGKERSQILAAQNGLDGDPNWVIQRALSQSVYPSGPYRRSVPGTREAVKRITRDDLVGFHRKQYTPENLIVVVVGNIDRAAAEDKVQRAFGDMPASGHEWVTPRPAAQAPAGGAADVVVKQRESELAHLAIGFPTAGVTREEYPAILVMNALMGGGMGSRLMREVRERQNLGYELGCYYTQFIGPSYLEAFIRTLPERPGFSLDGLYPTSEPILNKAKNAVLEQFDWVRQHPVPDAELERARRYTIGTFTYEHQRTLNQARYLGWFELVGLGYQFDDELPQLVEKVTREDVRALAQKYFTRYAVAVVMPEAKVSSE